MGRIDLSKLKVYNDLSRKNSTEIDIREEFANVIYRGFPGMQYHSLCHKIYDSMGEVELNDNECRLIKDAASTCIPAVYDAIVETLGIND